MMNSSEIEPSPRATSAKSTVKIALNLISWVLLSIVMMFIYWRVTKLLDDQRIDWSRINLSWLGISILAYGLSLAPQAWYFFRLIQSAKYAPAVLPTLRAHITGHLGKYVPGKTMVVLMRSALMKREGVPLLTTVWAAMLETTIFMAVGALLGAISFPYLLQSIESARWQHWLGPDNSAYLMHILPYRLHVAMSLIILTVILVPLLTPILDKLAGKLSQKKASNLQEQGMLPFDQSITGQKHIRQLDVWQGIGWETLSWLFQSLSLVTVMFAWRINAESPLDYVLWGSIVVVTTVLGFLAFFTPGGLGVKDALLVELLLLTSPISQSEAVAIAITHRLITLSGELILAGGMWLTSYKKSA